MKHENEKEKEKESLLKPDFLDLDGDGNKEESMKKAAQDKEKMRKPKADGGPEAEKRVAARGPETEKRVADTYKIKNPNDFKAQMYLGFAGSDKFLRGKDLKEEKEEISEIRKEFNKAFREARNEGLETFMFRGDEYHTRLKEEMEEMREPKVLGGLARGISKQLQKFISSSKSGMKTIQEGMQEPISPNELADVLEYNKLVSNPQDKIFYKKSDADYSSFFRNYIDGENSVITIKDAKQVLKESKKDLKQKRKEANTGQEMDELEMFENMVSDLEIDIRMIELDEPSIDKARGLLSEGGNVDKEMEQLRNMYEEGGEAKMIPDEQMEEQFVDFVIDEALSDKEESMLMEQLEANPELSMIFDKVIEKASEFTGAGEVEGPGTGTSDSIPARLSDGEFVFTAKSVEQIGADNLMKMMKDAEAAYDAGEDREKMQEGGLQEMSMDMERDMPNKKEVEVTYNVNRPETVSTVQPLLAREQEEDLITQKLKEDMLGPSKMR
jgi:hypothetical protein